MATVKKRSWTYKGEKKTAWVVRYMDGGGKQRLKTFQTKRDADDYRIRTEGDITKGTHVPESQSPTLSQFCDEFLRTVEDRKRDGRIGHGRFITLRRVVNVSIRPRLGAIKVCNLTSRQLEEFYNDMCRLDGLAPFTARSRVLELKIMLDIAIQRKYLRDNPGTQALVSLRGIAPPRVRTFTAEQVTELLRVAETRPYYGRERHTRLLRCFVNLAALCGLRLGEIMALKSENIDLVRRMVRIRHNLTPYDELKGPKTRSGNRDIPMPEHVAAMLEKWMRTHMVKDERGLIFRNEKGDQIKHSVFRTFWVALLHRAGLGNEEDELHFHALRHFAASWMIENGLPITDVAALLGHSKFDVTLQHYAHPVVAGNRRHDILERMSIGLVSETPIAIAPPTRAQRRYDKEHTKET